MFEAEDVALHALTSRSPFVTHREDGRARRLDCEIVAGYDGFGVSAIVTGALRALAQRSDDDET